MTRNVTLVEINIFDKMLPLVSGYLQAYACADSLLRDSYSFSKYTTTVTTPFVQLVKDLSQYDSQVYAFSCYLWNMGLIRSLLPPLLKLNPDAHFLLGGPQVMRHAHEYLDPEHETLVLCNGEGEKTFANYLRELTRDEPDLANVRGLSFYRDGTLLTTDPEDRIQSLDEIPSPFLTGVFDGDYRMSVIETNRGCPFRCSFCYWGAATNDRVYRFREDRVLDELTWLSRNGVPLLYIADANWGMLKRDVDIAEHIARCNKENGIPFYVYFAAAKNSPKKVAAIAEIFKGAGLLNTQPISMQSLDVTSLAHVDRDNIKLSAYEALQEGLNDKDISSYIELIWPLPGETLGSFKQGIEKLCELKAAHIIAYPHMLLHNTPLYKKKDEHKLVTRRVEDSVAEAELVVQTADVNREEFEEGLRFFYAVLALYNTNVVHRLGPYLHENRLMSHAQMLSAFVDVCREHEDAVFTQFCERSIREAEYYEMVNYPSVYHIVLHAARDEFDALLHCFASRQAWWTHDKARALFELDMLTKPYLYSNTPLKLPAFPLRHLDVLEVSGRSILVEVPDGLLPPHLEERADVPRDASSNGSGVYRLDHKRNQYPYRKNQNREENASYCSGSVMRIGNILPKVTREAGRNTLRAN